MAHQNARVLLRLINEILDLRKAQSGTMRLRISQFDLTTHLKLWVDSFKNLTQQRNISLTLDAPDALPFVGDLHRIELICYNLLSNAIKFTPDGGKVDVTVSKEKKGVAIKVSDTGKGIEKSELSHIFERFFQGNNNQGGTGIGLAVVKSFIELHQGSVQVESEVGKGTCFNIYLPQLHLEEQEESLQQVPQTITNSTDVDLEETLSEYISTTQQDVAKEQLTNLDQEGQTPTYVLVVDDHASIRDYVSQLLSEANYKVLTASNGEEGWNLALRQVPDLVVCDVSMPVMGGLELCRRLKDHEITSHIPVVLLTANSLDDHRAEGYDSGADAYITKPFNGKVLLSRIENLLINRQKLRNLFANITEPSTTPNLDVDGQFIENFKAKIREQLSNATLTVEDLSAEMGMSRVQLYRKVKALTDVSPVELIRITRLKRAESLLLQGGKTIAEVAYEVGFSSPSYFSKCFKEHFGCLPGEKLRP